jgi:hypothetical protein
MSDTLGRLCEVHYSAAAMTGSNAYSATWLKVDEIGDVTPNHNPVTFDRTTRSSGAFTSTGVAMRDPEVSFPMAYNPTGAAFIAFRTAHTTGVPIAVAIVDRAIATVGATGLVANWTVTGWGETEPLNDRKMIAVTLKPHSFAADFVRPTPPE